MATGNHPTASRRPLMFYRLAAEYDGLTSFKDTAGEVEYLERLVRRFCRSGGRSWLDVACGTGRHLQFLRRHYDVVGIDLSAPMLRLARRRLPTTKLLLGDMRSFELEESFDVVSCLFSAVGHLRSEAELRAAFRNFAKHLKPGGVCLVEPWIDPANFRPGFVHLVEHSEPTRAVARMSVSARRGNHSVVHYEYLVGDSRRGVTHFSEDDVGLLVPRSRLLSSMVQAGLKPMVLPKGLTPGRGLLVGCKPRPSPSSRGPRLRSSRSVSGGEVRS